MNVFSKNLLKNKEIGKSLIWVENLIKDGNVEWWEEIAYGGKPAGKV